MKIVYKGSILNRIADEKQEAIKLGKTIDYIEVDHVERHQILGELHQMTAYSSLIEFQDTGKVEWNGVTIHYNGWNA